MDDIQRQLRIAIFAIMIVVPSGIAGFMLIEDWSFLNAAYVTIITLSTVGYGDSVPKSDAGRLFTIFLLLFGLGAFAFAAQAVVGWITSPLLRERGRRKRIRRRIARRHDHYILCGEGEMVDKTINFIINATEFRRQYIREMRYQPIDRFLDRLLGDDADGHYVSFRAKLKHIIDIVLRTQMRKDRTLADFIVVVTQDEDYAAYLRDAGFLVIVGDPTDDDTLEQAGIVRARAMMVMLENDTETLMTVLNGHTLAPDLHITASVLAEELGSKMLRIGANAVINPFSTSGQFLTNATLRPAVNDYFRSIMYDLNPDHRLIALTVEQDSVWVGATLAALQLREKYQARVISMRLDDGSFYYAPDDDFLLEEDHVLLLIMPAFMSEILRRDAHVSHSQSRQARTYQPLPLPEEEPASEPLSLLEAERAIEAMQHHFIIAGSDPLGRSVFRRLNPDKPFVIICEDNLLTNQLLKRGFRVIHGDPTQEHVLRRAGIERAQAMMVAVKDRAASVLTILNGRVLNKQLLITTAAYRDDMVLKFERAGADRVISPFEVAARFNLLATTQPHISEFLEAVLYNYRTGLETTELYMEDKSSWVGQRLGDLQLREQYDAGVVGIRMADRTTFVYMPQPDYVIREHEVLIIITPMKHSDTLRIAAQCSITGRPKTLRRTQEIPESLASRDVIKELLHQRGQV